jgi:glucosyl-3-phosphoglycerate synthase
MTSLGRMMSRIFHHSEFSDLTLLLKRKLQRGFILSLCIPTLNEEATIGALICRLRKALIEAIPILDEILIVDSGSCDHTREEAQAAGASVFLASEILPELPSVPGKGTNLWKSLFVAKGNLLCFLDGDIRNIHPRFVYGLVGPLLMYPEIEYVKAFYNRPILIDEDPRPMGGGRVTEILVRPLFSIFFPSLSEIIQPLSGEYAAKRHLLENLSFPAGYGVETALLLDIYHKVGIGKIAQVDLGERLHRHQDILALGAMAFSILQTFLRRIPKLQNFPKNSLRQFYLGMDGYHPLETDSSSKEYPPMLLVKACRKK